MRIKNNKQLLLILLAAFCIRIVLNIPVFSNERKAVHHDTSSYSNIANNLINGNGYSNCSSAPYYKDVKRTPVYPYFLAGIYILTDVSFKNVVLVQILLDLITIILLFFIVSDIIKRTDIAILSCMLYAVSCHAISFCGSAISETLFVFLTMFLVYILRCMKKRLALKVVAFSLLWSMMVLCRPLALYSLPIFLGFWLYSEKSSTLIKISICGSAFVLSLILPSMWMQRNQNVTGVRTLSSIMDVNLLALNANAMIAKRNTENEDVLRQSLKDKHDTPVFSDCEGDYRYVKNYRTKGVALISSNLIEYITVHFSYLPNLFYPEVNRLIENWTDKKSNTGTLAIINKDGIVAGIKHYFIDLDRSIFYFIPFILIWIGTLCLSIIGFVKSLRSEYKAISIIALIFIAYFIVLIGPGSVPRFMFPNVPFICMFAALGLSSLLNHLKEKRRL